MWFPNHAESSRQALSLQRPNSFAFPAESSSRLGISPNDGRDQPAPLKTATPTYIPLVQGSQAGISPLDTAMTETLERQPRLASGYEWDERHHSIGRGQDGTACLSVEPDGDGYLGKPLIRAMKPLMYRFRVWRYTASYLADHRRRRYSAAPTTISYGAVRNKSTMDTIRISHLGFHQCLLLVVPYAISNHSRTDFSSTIQRNDGQASTLQVSALCVTRSDIRWDILSNTVIGLGAFCCGQPMYIVDYFLEKATAEITATQLESGSLELVQGFCLLSNLAQKRNKVNSGSVYLGIAVRMAIGLGLHRELPLWSISPFEREVR